MYIVLLDFLVMRPILSLPAWHGARWTAWFRECCKGCGAILDELILGLTPLRWGKKPLAQGEKIAVRLLIPPDSITLIPAFFRVLTATASRHEFSAASLHFISARDFFTNNVIWQNDAPTGSTLQPFSETHFIRDINALTSLPRFSLRFISPLRLPRPASLRPSRKDVARYAIPADLLELQGLAHLLTKIRHMSPPDHALDLDAHLTIDGAATNLHWSDLRYNEQRKIALGGICGQITFNGQPDAEIARRLILGQYLGAGKNARFGLGHWLIPEIKQH